MFYYTRNMDVCNWICENLRTWARNHVNYGSMVTFRKVLFANKVHRKNENLSVKSCGCMSFV